jgi:hypothetical protein
MAKSVSEEDYRNSVIAGLAQAMKVDVARIQEAAEGSDWYLSQLCQWYLMTPLERFLFEARQYDPSDAARAGAGAKGGGRGGRWESSDVQNSAIVLLSNLTAVPIQALQQLSEFALEELIAPFIDVHAVHERLQTHVA